MARWSLAAALVSLSSSYFLAASPPPAATTALGDDSGRQHPHLLRLGGNLLPNRRPRWRDLI